MLLPHAAEIRSAKTDGSMKRSPTMAMEVVIELGVIESDFIEPDVVEPDVVELGMGAPRAQGGELLPDRH
jgi:hypothetical protein